MTTNPDYCEVPLSLQYFEGLNKTKKRKLRRKKTTQLLEETQEQKKHTPSDNFKKNKSKRKTKKNKSSIHLYVVAFCFRIFFCYSFVFRSFLSQVT